MECTVELFGVPRQLMKTSQVELCLPAGVSLREVVTVLGQREAQMLGRVIAQDMTELVSPYMFYREGKGFVNDLSQGVEPGDRLLLMLAAVGG